MRRAVGTDGTAGQGGAGGSFNESGGGGGGGSGVGPAGTAFSLAAGPSGVVAVTYTAGPGSCTAPAVVAAPRFTG